MFDFYECFSLCFCAAQHQSSACVFIKPLLDFMSKSFGFFFDRISWTSDRSNVDKHTFVAKSLRWSWSHDAHVAQLACFTHRRKKIDFLPFGQSTKKSCSDNILSGRPDAEKKIGMKYSNPTTAWTPGMRFSYKADTDSRGWAMKSL